MEPELFRLLSIAARIQPFLDRLEGRILGPQPATVSNNADPENRRRVKVRLAKNPDLETDWLDRQIASPYDDPPVPKIGQTVVVNFYDGDPHRGYYTGTILNPKNKPQETESPLTDSARVIEGSRTEDVGGNDTQSITGDRACTVKGDVTDRSEQNHTLSVNQKLRLVNDQGAFVELHEAGAAIVGGIAGGQIVMGGLTAGLNYPTDFWIQATGTIRIDMQGHNLEIVNAANVSINGKQVATVGAPDTDGDTLVSRGW